MPDPTRDAVVIARNDLALRIAMDVLGNIERADGLAEWFGREHTDLGQAVLALLTAAEARGREQERARLAALSPGEVREMVEEFGAVNILCGVANAQSEHQRARNAADKADTLCEEIFAAFAAQRERVVGECVAILESEDVCSTPFCDAAGCDTYGVHCDEAKAAMMRALLAAPTKGEGG